MVANFLWSSGTGGPPNTGLVVSAFTLMSTDITSSAPASTTSLVSSGTAVSGLTVGSSVAGVFASSVWGQAMWCDIFVTHGTSTAATAAGANLAGWWMTTYDPNLAIFESTVNSSASPLARPPDWIIPMNSTQGYNAGLTVRTQGKVMLPALPCKVFIQNNTGVTMFSSATAYPVITVAAYAMQY